MNHEFRTKMSAKQQAALQEGSEKIMQTFQTPERLLTFLMEGLTWLNYMESENLDSSVDQVAFRDSHYDILLVMQHLFLTWANGGSDVVQKVSSKILPLYESSGPDGIYETVARTMAAFGKYVMDHSLYVGKALQLYMQGIKGLIELADCMAKYEALESPSKTVIHAK